MGNDESERIDAIAAMSDPAVQRALDLARSGQCRSIAEIIRHLAREDRDAVETHLRQPEARRQLILVCSEAWLAAN